MRFRLGFRLGSRLPTDRGRAKREEGLGFRCLGFKLGFRLGFRLPTDRGRAKRRGRVGFSLHSDRD